MNVLKYSNNDFGTNLNTETIVMAGTQIDTNKRLAGI